MDSRGKLRFLPTLTAKINGSVALSRGSTSFIIEGAGAGEALERILSACSIDGGATKEELAALFAEPEKTAAGQLVNVLLEKRILAPEDGYGDGSTKEESALDVFYWNAGSAAGAESGRLRKTKISIIGLNGISRRLAASLAESGAENVDVVDYPLFRNITMFGQGETPSLDAGRWPHGLKNPLDYQTWSNEAASAKSGLIIATSDFSGHYLMRDWNRYCVENKVFFLPVSLNKGIGVIGPVIAPGETCCLECMIIRENSNIHASHIVRAVDSAAFEGQKVAPVHPSMPSMLGDMAALELTRFFDLPWLWKKGSFAEVDMVSNNIRHLRVYRIPRCPVCGVAKGKQQLNTEKDDFDGGYSLVKRLEELSGLTNAGK